MEFALNWTDPSLAACDLTGEATVEELESMIDALVAHPEFREGANLVADATELEVSRLRAVDIRLIAEKGFRLLGRRKVRAAVVVGRGSPSRYGLARMLQTYVDLLAEEETLAAFATRAEAMAWIDRKRDDVATLPA